MDTCLSQVEQVLKVRQVQSLLRKCVRRQAREGRMTFEELVKEEVHEGLIRCAHWLAQQWRVVPTDADARLFEDLPDDC